MVSVQFQVANCHEADQPVSRDWYRKSNKTINSISLRRFVLETKLKNVTFMEPWNFVPIVWISNNLYLLFPFTCFFFCIFISLPYLLLFLTDHDCCRKLNYRLVPDTSGLRRGGEGEESHEFKRTTRLVARSQLDITVNSILVRGTLFRVFLLPCHLRFSTI